MRNRLCRYLPEFIAGISITVLSLVASAELTDITQTPNTVNAGIAKSLDEQIGLGRGDIDTPDSSLYIIKRDPFRAIVRGRQLFQRKFQVKQGFGPRANDGEGNLDARGIYGAGLADSCAACHGRPHGSAGFGGDVFTRPDSRDAPHLFGLGLVEMLGDEMTADLREIRAAAVERAHNRNSPVTRRLVAKGIRFGRITAHPDGSVDTSDVEGVDADLRIRPFLHQGRTFSIRSFIVGAFKAEMGMEAHDPDQLAASNNQDVVTPAGLLLSGSDDNLDAPFVTDAFEDNDHDGVSNEIPTALVDYLEFYLLNYFKPATYQQTATTLRGRKMFRRARCTECHVPTLTIERDRRVADVHTVYDPAKASFNNLYATAVPLFDAQNDGSGHPLLKLPAMDSFTVENFYSDLKRHDLGKEFWERNFDGTYQKEFVTEPLWGVGTTAPYGHDGRSINLREVILRHGGEAQLSKSRFKNMSPADQNAIIAFLQSLVLFPPPDTASNLDPADPSDAFYPQQGHGGVTLTPLFNDPWDPE